MTSIVWMPEPLARAVCKRLRSKDTMIVKSAREFLDAPRDAKTVSFVDDSTIASLDRFATELGAPMDVPSPEWWRLVAAVSVGPVIAICNETIQMAIRWLQPHPWLSHAVSASMLEHPMAEAHLNDVITTATASGTPRLLDWLGKTPDGRRIRLTHASKCAERVERMSQFFAAKNIDSRKVEMLGSATERLLRNAFYDAPQAAGALKTPLSPNQDVALPDDCACDLAYACLDELVIVRVRDPFGSLSRRRLVDVLTRCAQRDMQPVDETVEGSGLWRIFSAASFVAVSVVQHGHTEILVAIETRASTPPPFAFHLFFKEGGQRRFWTLSDEATGSGFSSSLSLEPKRSL